MTISPLFALLLSGDFPISLFELVKLFPYAILCITLSTLIFIIFGTHRGIWRYVSLSDFWRIFHAVTFSVLLTTFLYSFLSQKEVSISFQLFQWAFIILTMIALRICARNLLKKPQFVSEEKQFIHKQNILIIGLSHLTELYLRWVNEIEKNSISVLGILDETENLKGRSVQSCKVIGTPKDLLSLVEKYKIHGIDIHRIIITIPENKLSKKTNHILEALKGSSKIQLDNLSNKLLFTEGSSTLNHSYIGYENSSSSLLELQKSIPIFSHNRRYLRFKRLADLVFSLGLILFLSPLIAFVGLIVLFDLGYPLTFWQQRPGRNGKTFRLYKYRTMSNGTDIEGNRIPDEQRISLLGTLFKSQ